MSNHTQPAPPKTPMTPQQAFATDIARASLELIAPIVFWGGIAVVAALGVGYYIGRR